MRFIVLIASAHLVATAGCDESLPPRDDPDRFLQASYSVFQGGVEVRDSVAMGFGGRFVVSVKNTHSEVLQDDEYALADIDVWLRDRPEQRGKVLATRRDLTDPALVYGGQLTLRPNETATFLKQWEHKTTSGRYFWEFASFHFVPVPFTNGYWESDSVRLAARGKVQLFKTRAPELLSPMQFTLVYRLWVPDFIRITIRPAALP